MTAKEGAEDWERIYRQVPLEDIPWHSEKPPRYLVNLVEKRKVRIGLALDVCAGAGTNAAYLAKKGFDVVGVDISKTAVEFAKKRCEEAGISKKCNFFVGDLNKVRLPKNKFDFVFDRGCYHHISRENKPKFAKIISDVLKRGGKYLLSCFSDKNPHWEKNVSKEEIKENFSNYFAIGKIRDATWTEPTGRKVFFYVILMAKK